MKIKFKKQNLKSNLYEDVTIQDLTQTKTDKKQEEVDDVFGLSPQGMLRIMSMFNEDYNAHKSEILNENKDNQQNQEQSVEEQELNEFVDFEVDDDF